MSRQEFTRTPNAHVCLPMIRGRCKVSSTKQRRSEGYCRTMFSVWSPCATRPRWSISDDTGSSILYNTTKSVHRCANHGPIQTNSKDLRQRWWEDWNVEPVSRVYGTANQTSTHPISESRNVFGLTIVVPSVSLRVPIDASNATESLFAT